MNNKGFAPFIVLIIVAIVAIGGIVVYSLGPQVVGLFRGAPSPAPQQEAASSADYRVTKKNPKDPRYNLLRTKYHMSDAQIEALTTVSDTDR